MRFLGSSLSNVEIEEIEIDDPTRIDAKTIENEISKLAPYKPPIFQPKNYVLRTKRHAVAWMHSYLIAEVEELTSSFVSEIHTYQVVLLRAANVFQISFRLMTVGKGGFTEYRIAVRKIGDYFACTE